ncbi:MAG TPA: hypothetical protein VL970_11360 [Candidatus Acidoferrales bacterium]|nr:hypothetical protein [Candidatus Acidoferrales bacterium]
MLAAVTLWATASQAQSTNEDFPVTFSHWGESVHNVRLAIAMTNSAVQVGASFHLFIALQNGSTNVIYVRESTLGGNYIVTLNDGSGRSYKVTKDPIVTTYNMLLSINPDESLYWFKTVKVDHYYKPHKIMAAKVNVPPGDYTLEVTRTFFPQQWGDPEPLRANPLELTIK